MPELVALDLPGGKGFVDALRSVWDTGDAICPLDSRLPEAAKRALVDALRPTRIVGPDGQIVRLDGGEPVEPGDGLVIATSGSTGYPKGVVLTHDALTASAIATSTRLGIDPDRHRWLAALPLAHIGGLSVVIRALLTDTPLSVLPGFDAEEVSRLAREAGVTHVSLVPTALGRLDPALFECILLGGSAMPRTLPRNVVTTYGLTESGSGVVYDGMALDGVDIALRPIDASTPNRSDFSPGDGSDGGDEGEILLRGPMMMRTFRNGQIPYTVGPDSSHGWLPTGDGGELAPDGKLRVHGRIDDVIVTGSEKVWPTSVEAIISTLPSVAEVAAWKRPDPEWGERVVAWIVPRDPTLPPSLDDLAEPIRAALSPWAVPKEIVIVDALPRTGSGKVIRRNLS